MKYVYPAVFRREADGRYFIFFPDIESAATQGNDTLDGMEMAEDALCLALYDMEQEGETIPPPSDIKSLELESEDFATLISADTEYYRRFNEQKLIKKTLNIPSWLNAKAEAENINFSQILQRALKEELQIAE